MPTVDKKTDLLEPLTDVFKRVKDREQRKLLKRYMEVVTGVNDTKDFVEQISDKYVEDIDERQRAKLESVIQNIEAKLLEINSDYLEFIELVTDRDNIAKGELGSYFMDQMKAIVKDLETIYAQLKTWTQTIEEKGAEAIQGDMLQKSLTWLRSRTSGALIRINNKNQNLGKILDKLRREQVTQEVKNYVRESLGIKGLYSI